MTTKFQLLEKREMQRVSGGWWSFLLIAPFALGAAIRYAIDPGAYK